MILCAVAIVSIMSLSALVIQLMRPTPAQGIRGVLINPMRTGSYDAWFGMESGAIDLGATYTDNIYVNTGTSKIGAYSFTITYDPTVIQVDLSQGEDGAEPGADGFVAAANMRGSGSYIVNGFDAYGKGPSFNLHLVTLHWKAVGKGTTDLRLEINSLTDETGEELGDKDSFSCTRIVS